MIRTLILLPLLLFALEPAPAVLFVSNYAPKQVTLPDPTVAPTPAETLARGLTDSAEVYRYALVDEAGLLSPWSDPVTLKLSSGANAYFTPTSFVPDEVDARAMLWSIDGHVGIAQEGGVGPEQFTPPLPLYSPISPRLQSQLGRSGHAAPLAGTSPILKSKPPTPKFQASAVPNRDYEVCYTFVGENGGETRASPVALSRKHAANVTATFRTFVLPDVVMPAGAVGYRLYFREPGGPWRRVGEYPLDMMQPTVWTLPARSPGLPAPNAVSTLSPLQQALSARRTRDVVVVDVPETETAVPILDPWGAAWSVVSGLHGQPWTIKYTGSGEVALLCQSQYTTWERMTVEGGVRATSNFSGGQAFGHVYRECTFRGGVRTLDTSSRWRVDHTESEALFDDCTFGASKTDGVGIRIEGAQSANIRFRRTHAYGDWYRRPGSAALWIATQNPVVFTDGLYADFGARLAYLEGANVRIDDLWLDQGHSCVFETVGYYPSKVRVREGKMNLWTWALAQNPDGSWTVDSFGHHATAPTMDDALALVPKVARQPWLFKGPRDSRCILTEVVTQTNHPTLLKWREAGTTPGPVVSVPFP
jgi:hypothetical protein